jgi:hypothetical protein
VQVWTKPGGELTPDCLVNLQVFVDGTNDYHRNDAEKPLTLWRTSKARDDDGAPGTWHWPEYVPAKG